MFPRTPRHVLVFSIRVKKRHSSWRAELSPTRDWSAQTANGDTAGSTAGRICSTEAEINFRCSKSDTVDLLFSHQLPLPCIPTSSDFQWHCVQPTRIRHCSFLSNTGSLFQQNNLPQGETVRSDEWEISTCWAFKVSGCSEPMESSLNPKFTPHSDSTEKAGPPRMQMKY